MLELATRPGTFVQAPVTSRCRIILKGQGTDFAVQLESFEAETVHLSMFDNVADAMAFAARLRADHRWDLVVEPDPVRGNSLPRALDVAGVDNDFRALL